MYKLGSGPEIAGTTSRDKKTPLINYVFGDQKSLRSNKIHSITLELSQAINHCDVRRDVSVTNAKEKRFYANISRDLKSNLDLSQTRFTNKIITAEQKQQIRQNIHV